MSIGQSERAYPTRPDSTGVSVFACGNEASLVCCTACQMERIWPELKKAGQQELGGAP